MAEHCCGADTDHTTRVQDQAWRRALWIALAINGGMFCVEIMAGVSAQSASLRADALDFLGDTANYAISLGVAGLALRWRAWAAIAKGVSLTLLAIWVLGSTIWMATTDTLPAAETMGAVGITALFANVPVHFCSGAIGEATPTGNLSGSARATTPLATSLWWQQRLACLAPAPDGRTLPSRQSWQAWAFWVVPRSFARRWRNCMMFTSHRNESAPRH